MNRIAWIDTETTGLDSSKCDVVQIALLIEEQGKVIAETNIKMRPHPNAVISDAALRTTNTTIEEISKYPSQMEGIKAFKNLLNIYVNPRDKKDKFFFAGYNCNFDVDFLHAAFMKVDDPYFFSWFFSCFIDVRSFVGQYFYNSPTVLGNYKLSTVCSHFDIDFKAHDAMEDIRATRELYYALKQAPVIYDRIQ